MAYVMTKLPPVEMPDGTWYDIPRLTARGETNAKLALGAAWQWDTLGLVLAPHRMAQVGNFCSHATDCIDPCLADSGHSYGLGPVRDRIIAARIARARLYHQARGAFLGRLEDELSSELNRAIHAGRPLCFRPNVLSDLDWARLHPTLITDYPAIQWYGYTKNPNAYSRFLAGRHPANYHLVFSRSGTNQETALDFLARGGSVAVVFDTRYSNRAKQPLPAEWQGYRVIDGDQHDLRFLDPVNVVIGLRAKGHARDPKYRGSFVVATDQDPIAPRVIS